MSRRRKKKKRQVWWAAYKARNDLLKSIGFETYDDYLKSPLWRAIRKRHLTKYSKCKICSETASTVHHTKYTRDNLSGKNDGWLVSLCEPCHKAIEWDHDSKRGLEGANNVLLDSIGDSRQRKRKTRNTKPVVFYSGNIGSEPCPKCGKTVKSASFMRRIQMCQDCRRDHMSRGKTFNEYGTRVCSRCGKQLSRVKQRDGIRLCKRCGAKVACCD